MAAGVPIHEQVLDAAVAICGRRRGATFLLREVVDALPHLNPGTVRTHVASRCCVNAPAHHASRWPYFRATERGRYRVEPKFRKGSPRTSSAPGWQDRILAAMPSGIDPTQISERLQLTPTERIERMIVFARFLDIHRPHRDSRLPNPVRSAR